MGASPKFEENGGARRMGGEATPRGDRGCEPRHWRREKRGQCWHLYVCKRPRGVRGSVARLSRYLRLILPGYAWFELRYRAALATSKPQVFSSKTKIEKNEAQNVPKDKRRSEDAIQCRFLGRCSVPRMSCQHCAGP